MRRRAVIAPIVLVAAALLAWRRRRARAAAPPLGSPAKAPAVARPAAVAQLPAATPDSPFLSVPWTLVAAPADRAELTVRYAARPELELDRVDAQETPTQVFVTVLMRSRAATAVQEEAAPGELEATVPLSGPLGARELIHAPADAGGEPNGSSVYP